MSKRTKLKLRHIRMSLTKYVFNSKYIVRNTLAVTVLTSVTAMIMGISTVVAGDVKDKTEEYAAEAELKSADMETTTEVIYQADEADREDMEAIHMVSTPNMDADSINILMAMYDDDSVSVVEAKTTQVVTEGKKPFEHKFIAISDGVNVRREADIESDVVGALYINDIGTLTGIEGDWYQISIGDIDGYVRNDFALTGDAAESYAEEKGIDIDAVMAGTYVRVPVEDNGDVEVTTESDKEESASEVVTEEFTTEEVTTESVTEEVTTEAPTTEAPTTEAPTTEAVTTETPTEETTTEEITTEATEASTEEPTTEAVIEDNGNEVEMTVTTRTAITLSEEDINLMASIMTLECGGESYEGQLAVANVIINRLQSGVWGSTISDVVYASGQFSTAYSSSLDYYLENGAQSSCIKAAKDALAGTNNAGSYVSFRPVSNVDTSTLGTYTIIGNHIFF